MESTMFNYEDNGVLKTLLTAYYVFLHVLMGVVVAIPLLFAVVKEYYATSVSDDIILLHILLCVPGYQLLMSLSFLSLCPYNILWTTKSAMRRAHWILQLLGSGLALAGSFIIMVYKDVNFNTVHGRLGLAAAIFTTVGLVTGVAALFAKRINFIPGYVSKIIHIVLGNVTFALAAASICYAYKKNSFRIWTNDQVVTGVIALTAIFTVIILINPCITLGKKVTNAIRYRSYEIVNHERDPIQSRCGVWDQREKTAGSEDSNAYCLKTFQTALNLLAHTLIGFVVSTALVYVFNNGLPLGATSIHIVLCVLGYQLLMAQAVLSLCHHNGWSAHLKLVDKRRAHWILQILGSGLAIVGSFVKIADKTVHWNTPHGRFALIALIFTVVSLVNGLTSLWAYELKRFIPTKLSKVTHICFGIIAFGASTIALCYGFEKNSIKSWTGDAMTYTIMTFAATYSFIIIVNPCITFVNKIKN